MKTADIENLAHKDLKARRDELVNALVDATADVPRAELAARYVQARTDAAHRDEKLAEQAVTIGSLNTAIGDARQKVEEQAKTIEVAAKGLAEADATITKLRVDHAAELERLTAAHAAEVAKLKAEYDGLIGREQATSAKLTADLAEQTARGDRLGVVATRHLSAVTAAAKLLNDSLAAQSIEDAGTGPLRAVAAGKRIDVTNTGTPGVELTTPTK